ncbi:MAG: tRNA pseudouridine(38-40) synthase TruA [Dehalococcoidia bacterium]|nr:tRNA pseudouridine(38-40) synthase TruA [Dehalococcoidia bacterium]
MIIEYDGTGYHGFQVQNGVRTIQGDIEQALFLVTGERIRITGAGRTDAGVHAKKQVVSLSTASRMAPETLGRALNFYLGREIAVKSVRVAQPDFNARRDAISREYSYRILNSPVRSPLLQNHAHHLALTLDAGLMNEACKDLEGVHDFASFTGPTEKRTVRNVHKAMVSREGDLVTFTIAANSFLPRQVRNTMGSLIKVGTGRMAVNDFAELLEAKAPGLAGPAVPAQGLYLVNVKYPDNKLDKGRVDENV